LASLAPAELVERLWARDSTLWTDRDENRWLGWLDEPLRMRQRVTELEEFAAGTVGQFDSVVLLGMGGSSLAPEVLRRTFESEHLQVLDTTHPAAIRRAADSLDPARTLFLVSSKSGTTLETRCHLDFFWHWTRGRADAFAAITDPGSELESLARKRGFRAVFAGELTIGGRYSALSAFGMVPAALLGVDLERFLLRVEEMVEACHLDHGNPGLELGERLGEGWKDGRDKVQISPIPGGFGLWVEQLVAESTGKQGRGILPVADEPLVDPKAYGQDRVLVHLASGDEANAAHVAALRKGGHPTITVRAEGPADLGRIDFYSEFATAVAGWVLEINPFDQPNVQEAKDNTSRVLKEGSPDLDAGSLDALLDGLEPPRYVAIMAYLPYSDETDRAAARLRERIVSEHGVATTFGYGPRFLHSTGQFHKGGPPTGAFVQIVDEPSTDIEVPGEPYSFGTLIRAQADGDLQTLRAHGLDAVRVGKEIL
jgi:transaldolase / glucose-6-phosphate isomerase